MRRLQERRRRRIVPLLDYAIAAGKPGESAWLPGLISLFRCRPAAIRCELSDHRLPTSSNSVRRTHLRKRCSINAETSRGHGQIARCGQASRLPSRTLEASFIQSGSAKNQTQAKQRSRAVGLLEGAVFHGLIAAIVFTAIPYGTVDPWSQAVFECAVFLLGLLWVVHGLLEGSWRV